MKQLDKISLRRAGKSCAKIKRKKLTKELNFYEIVKLVMKFKTINEKYCTFQ